MSSFAYEHRVFANTSHSNIDRQNLPSLRAPALHLPRPPFVTLEQRPVSPSPPTTFIPLSFRTTSPSPVTTFRVQPFPPCYSYFFSFYLAIHPANTHPPLFSLLTDVFEGRTEREAGRIPVFNLFLISRIQDVSLFP